MRAGPARRRKLHPAGLGFAAGVTLPPVILAGLAGWAAGAASTMASFVIGAGGALALAAAMLSIARMRATSERSEARFAAIFERAGISMWREDWTEAARAVMELRHAGVTDIECYYASRPDELRALCAKVIVTDVNAFTLEETGATDKSAYLGPLDRLLPSTDQTFVQWLVAFGRGDRFFRSEAHVVRADGSEGDTLFTAMLPQDLDGFAEIIVTSLDVTAFKQAQANVAVADSELARSSRITTVGALSASIAHEVNSPLAVIVANAEAALRWLKRPQPDVEAASAALDDVVGAAIRARDVISRTRSYLGNAPRLFTPVDPLQAARDANLLIEREIRVHGATVHIAADGEIPLIAADPIQIQQVFVNLLLNAAQAMTDSAGRRDILVAIRREAAFVAVTVSDTGPGIAQERRARIFEPFHSTKANGMGMGLAICRNLIDAHGGDIRVDAAPGGGAAFHITLPISDA
ncbi:sensor histidine kinase [Methylobacterium sp. CM6244]